MATCRIHEIDERYENIECSWEAWNQDPEGLCLLHSRQVDKDKDGIFTEAVKAKLRAEDYDFRGVFFPSFNLVKLTGQDRFTFTKLADFSWSIFQKQAFFFGTTFQEAYFSWATFQDAQFGNATFQDADFRDATFQDADFQKSTFQKAYFDGATFKDLAHFNFAIFKEADFKGTTFQKANFDGASFQEAYFAGATFQEAVFSVATFQKVAGFSMATFKEANFVGASFQEAHFYKATFQEANFSGVTFTGRTWFEMINPHKEGKPRPPLFSGKFEAITVDKEGSLVFDNSSLARIKFALTDLRRVEFNNVTWARRHGRNVVYDEILLHQNEQMPSIESYARVEELYRGLKLNYGQAGDLKKVGDFHYGEMEMHRRANPTQLWYQLYWVTSGYGERPLRSLLVLWGLFLTFAGVFFWLEPCLLGGHTWEGLGNALLYVFQKGTLQRPESKWIESASSFSKFLAALIPVVIPGQVALFFLALRNRLGRRR
jgi:uncharacterized protein YjbI with pentapeptide repeats